MSKSHKQQILPPKLLAKYQAGDILGHADIDENATGHVDTFLSCSQKAEVALFEKHTFDFLWNI